EVLNDAGDLLSLQRARLRVGAAGAQPLHPPGSGDRAGSDRQLALEQLRIGDPPYVPQLQKDPPAGSMDSLGDLLPPGDLLLVPDARGAVIANPLGADGGGL